MMKTATLMRLAMAATALAMAGCASHHGMGMYDGETALERGIAETNDMIDRTVKDPDRAKQAKAVLQEIIEEVKSSAQTSRKFHEQMIVVNADYDAKPEQFTKILDDMNNARMASSTRILGLRFKMKALLTAEEWNELTGVMDMTRKRYMPKAGGM